ncbi:MAG TPA: nitroreductase family protein [Candidatus Brocadiia bacterium]|nr:nitroreductase family protein [Candidatus Brocadiia bacterium]
MMNRKRTPPIVDISKCVGCGQCARVCVACVLEMKDKKSSVAHPGWCIDCGHCAAVCPVDAVTHPAVAGPDAPKPGAKPAVTPDDLQMLLRERRSVRNYRNEPVPRDVLARIIEAGRYAPTATNLQAVHYVVLTTKADIDRLRDMTVSFYRKLFALAANPAGRAVLGLKAGREAIELLRFYGPQARHAEELAKQGHDRLFYHAPAMIIAHSPSGDTSSCFNCAAAIYNCSLMAHTLGVGCCFNGFVVNAIVNEKKISSFLGIPPGHSCYAAMTLGYQDVKFRRLAEREPAKISWK